MHTIYHFHVDIADNVPSLETLPLIDDQNKLVGSIVRWQDDKVRGFISGENSPISLKISLEEPLYLTPMLNNRGLVTHAIITELPTSIESIKIPYVVENLLANKEETAS